MAGLNNQCLLPEHQDDEFQEKIPIKSVQDSPRHDEKERTDATKGEEVSKMVGSFELFRFADVLDKLLMVFGSLMAAINGANIPALIILLGHTLEYLVDIGRIDLFLGTIPEYLSQQGLDKDDFMAELTILDDPMCDDIAVFYNGTNNCTITVDDTVMDKVSFLAALFAILGLVSSVLAYGQVTFWMVAAHRQSHRIRKRCLYTILHQHIGWFDTHNVNELNTRLVDDIPRIQDGIGDKIGSSIKCASAIICSLGISFYYGWKLTLVVLSCFPVSSFCWTMMSKLVTHMVAKEAEAYNKAGAIAEEVFGAIRTVVAFGGQEKESRRYFEHLDEARRCQIKKGFSNGILTGMHWMVMFSSYALGFWYGGKLHLDNPDDFDISDMIIVFYSIMYAAAVAGSLAPGIQAFATAKASAHIIFQLIDAESQIDPSSKNGLNPWTVDGLIQLKNVHFGYPSRQGVTVLNNVSFEARPGQMVALVGSSGSGKSTVVQLLLRFYHPEKGQVMLDGRDIRDYNIKWLRQNIGLVSQEPVLFSGTIEENIRNGREDATFDQIVTATKNANAYDFISQLPDKFNTMVGEQGAQLSGGQKQRIAIARALVRDPKILLLDEATSALDTESEAIVQDALDKARQGRTTIVVAHRLSSIKNADIIVGLHNGHLKETGNHSELMAQQGIYYQLVLNQQATLNDDYGEESHEDKPGKQSKTKSLTNSVTSRLDVKEEEEIEETLPDAPFTRIMKMSAPEWYYIVLGSIASIASGSTWPILAYLFSDVIKAFAGNEQDEKDDFERFAFVFIGFGLMNLISSFTQSYMFACSGEALTLRIRDLTFRSLIKQEIAWFDDAKNAVGALTTRLSIDAAQVQGMAGYKIGGAMMGMSSFSIGMGIAFYYSWKLSLVTLCLVPLIGGSAFLEIRLLADQSAKTKQALEGAGKITAESLGNIRTVAALSLEQTIFDRYNACMSATNKDSLKKAHVIGIVYCISQSFMFFMYTGPLVFGGYLVEQSEMKFDDVFRVFGSVLMGAFGVGSGSALFPDMGKARTSAQRILHIIDSTPNIDYTSAIGKKLKDGYHAALAFKDVTFHYATRASAPVLQGLNVSVTPGQTLALVGSSGCGKSTSIQLIERFYDSVTGSVYLDNHDTKSLNIQWYRSQLGLVSQEPVLFNCSIKDNIAYGDNTREVDMSEIIEVAKRSNVHNFIASLPDGYETHVGTKGTQLSGGQKQRVAIARALIRNPKILLLDEATSALDTESEKIVQQALDKAQVGRTSIVIAHRLSTIQKADKICVMDQGQVVEQGTHSELLARQGFYYALVRASQRRNS